MPDQYGSLHSSEVELTLGPEDDSLNEEGHQDSCVLPKIDLPAMMTQQYHQINKPVSQFFCVTHICYL